MQATVATPQQLAEALHRVSAHINKTASPDMFRVLGEVGLSFTQMKALFLLADRADLTVKDLADRLAMSLPAMSRSVEGLVQRGYVARHECESDRRAKRVTLLPQGREVLGRVTAAREQAIVEFAAALPDAERTALHAALLPIAERISHGRTALAAAGAQQGGHPGGESISHGRTALAAAGAQQGGHPGGERIP